MKRLAVCLAAALVIAPAVVAFRIARLVFGAHPLEEWNS
jgi:hypothetical protein